MKNFYRAFFVSIAMIAMTWGRAFDAQAAFDPNHILSDSELTDYASFSRTGIRDFLQAKGSGLRDGKYQTPSGARSPADIIMTAANYYKLSPKFLLTLLQKEQSLITTAVPTQRQLDWATGYGVCDSCSKDDPAISKFRGFFNQVNWAARRIRETYMPLLASTGKIFSFGPGVTTPVDDTQVTPANDATAILYQYTPHIHGNQVFSRIWQEWFTRLFPDGTLVQEENTDSYYLIDGGKRRPFRSLNVLLSSNYDPKKAVRASETDLDAYELGDAILFPNYSLVRIPNGTIYLMVDGTKRRIVSMDVFRTIGFNPEEIIEADAEDVKNYHDGEPIGLESAYPEGALLQSATTGGIAYVENGVRHAIYDRSVLRSRFGGRPITRIAEDELQGYPLGDPVLLRDGELVMATDHATVYFISHGMKRPIVSRSAFERLGFQWSNILMTTQRVLDLHPTGDALDAGQTTVG